MSAASTRVEVAAAAIANARGMRRGVPTIKNILDILPEKLRAEVMEDAEEALAAVDAFDRNSVSHGHPVGGSAAPLTPTPKP